MVFARVQAAVLACLLFVLALAAPARPAFAQQAQAPDWRQKPAPRVLILTFGKADKGEFAAIVQNTAEAALLEQQFALVDETQVMAGYQLEDLERFLVMSPELVRISELKARFGAEIVLVVQYTRIFQYEKDFFGSKSRFFKNDVRVKAILPDTAETIYAGGESGSIEARTIELEELTRKHVLKCGLGIYERWSKEASGPSTYQVVTRGFDHEAVSRIEGQLRAKSGVKDVIEREFGGKTMGPGAALIEVKFTGTIDELKGALQTISEPALDVKSASGNRIEVVPGIARLKIGFTAPEPGALLAGEAAEAEVAVLAGEARQVDVNGVAAAPVSPGRYRARIPLQGGENRLVAHARDALDRESTAEVTVRADLRPPTIRIIEPASGVVTNQKAVTVVIEADDDGDQLEVTVNGQPAQGGKREGRFRAKLELPDGVHEIVAIARDGAGQTAEARTSVKIDSVPPQLTGTVSAVIEGRVDKAGVTLTLDGRTIPVNADGTFRIVVEAPPGGTVTIVATDAAGNRTEKVYKIGGR